MRAARLQGHARLARCDQDASARWQHRRRRQQGARLPRNQDARPHGQPVARGARPEDLAHQHQVQCDVGDGQRHCRRDEQHGVRVRLDAADAQAADAAAVPDGQRAGADGGGRGERVGRVAARLPGADDRVPAGVEERSMCVL